MTVEEIIKMREQDIGKLEEERNSVNQSIKLAEMFCRKIGVEFERSLDVSAYGIRFSKANHKNGRLECCYENSPYKPLIEQPWTVRRDAMPCLEEFLKRLPI
jgi:hypothetical protein